MRHPALLVIDLQNDYFPGGAFPLSDTEATLATIERAIAKAHAQGLPVLHIQHLADPAQGLAPLFNADTFGAAIHPRVLAAAPEAPIIIKHFADSFERTRLADVLQELGVNELLLCGMMTHNCVTHTALSRQADHYQHVTVLSDACCTVSPLLHAIALRALAPRITLAATDTVLS